MAGDADARQVDPRQGGVASGRSSTQFVDHKTHIGDPRQQLLRPHARPQCRHHRRTAADHTTPQRLVAARVLRVQAGKTVAGPMLACAHAPPESTTQAAEKPNKARRWIVMRRDATPQDIDPIRCGERCRSRPISHRSTALVKSGLGIWRMLN